MTVSYTMIEPNDSTYADRFNPTYREVSYRIMLRDYNQFHQKKKEKETTAHALNQCKNLKHPRMPKTEYLEHDKDPLRMCLTNRSWT